MASSVGQAFRGLLHDDPVEGGGAVGPLPRCVGWRGAGGEDDVGAALEAVRELRQIDTPSSSRSSPRHLSRMGQQPWVDARGNGPVDVGAIWRARRTASSSRSRADRLVRAAARETMRRAVWGRRRDGRWAVVVEAPMSRRMRAARIVEGEVGLGGHQDAAGGVLLEVGGDGAGVTVVFAGARRPLEGEELLVGEDVLDGLLATAEQSFAGSRQRWGSVLMDRGFVLGEEGAPAEQLPAGVELARRTTSEPRSSRPGSSLDGDGGSPCLPGRMMRSCPRCGPPAPGFPGAGILAVASHRRTIDVALPPSSLSRRPKKSPKPGGGRDGERIWSGGACGRYGPVRLRSQATRPPVVVPWTWGRARRGTCGPGVHALELQQPVDGRWCPVERAVRRDRAIASMIAAQEGRPSRSALSLTRGIR